MRNGVGMWGLRLVLLAMLVVLVIGMALFSSSGSEVWRGQRAEATLLLGPSGPGRADLSAALSPAPGWSAGPVDGPARAFARWTDPGRVALTVGGGIAGLLSGAMRPEGPSIWWQATGGSSGNGGIVPLWDLLAVTAMVVTFGVLLGSWVRRGR